VVRNNVLFDNLASGIADFHSLSPAQSVTIGPSRTNIDFTAAPEGSPALASLSVSPETVAAADTCTGTVTLTAGAPAGGFRVKLRSSKAVARVPRSVLVSEGAAGATFPVTLRRPGKPR
jgi:hypothetical protein